MRDAECENGIMMMEEEEEEEEKGRRDFVGRDDALPSSLFLEIDCVTLFPMASGSSPSSTTCPSDSCLVLRPHRHRKEGTDDDDKRAISARLHRRYLNFAIPPARRW